MILPDRTEILNRAAADLKGVLDAVQETVNSPDYRGSEWLEVYRGNRLLPEFVMVDFVGNALHVERRGTSFRDERMTVTYLPSWFAAVLLNSPARMWDRYKRRSGDILEVVTAAVSDRDAAAPLSIEIRIDQPTGVRMPLGAGQPAGAPTTAALPQIYYDLGPSTGSMLLREGAEPDEVAALGPKDGLAFVDRMHWIAPSVQITAAPGVAVETRWLYPGFDTDYDPWSLDLSGGVDTLATTPLWGWFVMNAAYQQDDLARRTANTLVSSQQALQVIVERFQNAEAVPPPGTPRRVGGVSEVDFLNTDSKVGARFEEQTRPDGVDLVFLTAAASADQAATLRDPWRALLHATDPMTSGMRGAIPPNSPVPVTIRVDPQSAADRFAYSVTALADGQPSPFPSRQVRGKPLFRLSVIRTPGVRVTANLFYGAEGIAQIKEVVDFRELVVPTLDKVPTAILDHGDKLLSRPMPSRPLTPAEIYDLTVLAVGMVPFPPCQVMADLNDYATILLYLSGTKDPFGREVATADFVGSLAGILLPEVLEVVAKKAIRLVAAWDRPGWRIVETFQAVSASALSTTMIPFIRRSTP